MCETHTRYPMVFLIREGLQGCQEFQGLMVGSTVESGLGSAA